ncbi:hypothetical protein GGR56DRAFT_386542 [Xylariaceae sp. FL0804]|nr:hypothetical protein GGR56DRAFT_386542 [Xylariaceae sp. FL0804]
MSTEREIVHQFSEYAGQYIEVNVLQLYWREGDLNGIEDEVKALGKVFESFGYTVTLSPIPTDVKQQQGHVYNEVASFSLQSQPRTLSIIYYGGHGYHDDKTRKPMWSAFRPEDENDERPTSTLRWDHAQELLFQAKGDVLLILDCCNGSDLVKGTKEFGRFELLAASAKNHAAVGPGRNSFTALLTKELGKRASEGIEVQKLGDILREHGKIREHPVNHNFVRGINTSIRLQSINSGNLEEFIRKPKGYLFLRVSLSEDMTGLQIADWLKRAPPKHVTSIHIETIVTNARRLQGLVDDSVFTGTLLSNLSQAAREEIRRQFSTLNTTMETAEHTASKSKAEVVTGSISKMYHLIRESVSNAHRALETSVLLGLSARQHVTTSPKEKQVLVEIAPAIQLRDAILRDSDISKAQEVPREKISLTHASSRLQIGVFDEAPVIIETYKYQEDPETDEPYDETLKQLHKMAGLLSHPKILSFHILTCVGFYHHSTDHVFGLVFEQPPEAAPAAEWTTLSQLYKTHELLPLGYRVRLCHALADGMEHFHRVGWVHKSLRSDNIAFSPVRGIQETAKPEDSVFQGQVDFAQPYLFGFEFSRVNDAETRMDEDFSEQNNLYRHPERWGRPSARFTHTHDIYALGVVLLEVAMWKDVRSIVGVKKDAKGRPPPTNSLKPHEVQQRLLRRSRKHLPHQVGQKLADAIGTCLDFDGQTVGMDEYTRQVYFQQHVSQKVLGVAGNV